MRLTALNYVGTSNLNYILIIFKLICEFQTSSFMEERLDSDCIFCEPKLKILTGSQTRLLLLLTEKPKFQKLIYLIQLFQ